MLVPGTGRARVLPGRHRLYSRTVLNLRLVLETPEVVRDAGRPWGPVPLVRALRFPQTRSVLASVHFCNVHTMTRRLDRRAVLGSGTPEVLNMIVERIIRRGASLELGMKWSSVHILSVLR